LATRSGPSPQPSPRRSLQRESRSSPGRGSPTLPRVSGSITRNSGKATQQHRKAAAHSLTPAHKSGSLSPARSVDDFSMIYGERAAVRGRFKLPMFIAPVLPPLYLALAPSLRACAASRHANRRAHASGVRSITSATRPPSTGENLNACPLSPAAITRPSRCG
jgi:hypothetical protein